MDHQHFLERALIDGSAEVYNEWAPEYDKFLASTGSSHASLTSLWLNYHPELETKHKVFDAGCGTGLLGEEMLKVAGSTDLIEIYGGDLSPGMLEMAKGKKVYCDLKIVNLKEELPYEPETFDSVVSAGTFLQGHCGPECLPNVIRVLKKSCYFIMSARTKFYKETKSEWKRQMEECNCELIEEREIRYSEIATGHILVVQKKA